METAQRQLLALLLFGEEERTSGHLRSVRRDFTKEELLHVQEQVKLKNETLHSKRHRKVIGLCKEENLKMTEAQLRSLKTTDHHNRDEFAGGDLPSQETDACSFMMASTSSSSSSSSIKLTKVQFNT